MTEKHVCEICGTIYDGSRDRCPLCETPYQAYTGETEEFDEYEYDYEEARPVKQKGSGFKGVVAVLLSLLLVAFGGFIAYEWLIGSPNIDGSVPCTGLYLAEDQVELSREGETFYLSVSLSPSDATDVVTYTSADEAVVTVDEHGKMTAVGMGQTQVSVTCGGFSAQCLVICELEE